MALSSSELLVSKKSDTNILLQTRTNMFKNNYPILQIFLYLICVFFSTEINAQISIKQIDTHYQKLDSNSYLNKAIQKKSTHYSKDIDTQKAFYNRIKNKISNNTVIYALNIHIDTALLLTDNYIEIDTCEYKFSLIFFDKNCLLKSDISFVNNEIYPFFYPFTGSRLYKKRFYDGYKKVFKLKPQYILACYSLPHTIIYVYNNQLYLYQIWSRKTYDIKNYLAITKLKNNPFYNFYTTPILTSINPPYPFLTDIFFK